MNYKNTYIRNPLVSENVFRSSLLQEKELPKFEECQGLLPQPFWEKHNSVIDCYWKAWKLAFNNLKKPTKGNGFVANFIDTAYNNNLFMWDSAFICLFARYGSRPFNFQQTLDNFYAKQHPDGFICREIRQSDGKDCFHRFDPVSTGPNVLPWCEWEYFQNFGDCERLDNIFPALAAYYQWLKHYRTWPNGTYWASGWATGMDNQPRVQAKYNRNFSHGHMIWIDACLQQIMSGKILLKMGEILERWQEIEEMEDEIESLTSFININLWDEQTAFYYDMHADGKLNKVKSIGAYWALLADVVSGDRRKRFVEHLEKENEFKRPHRIPSLSADHPVYKQNGRYWLGGVWAPTNYMVLKGLNHTGYDALAHEIALNHLLNVVKIYEETGTLWENYAPESKSPGQPAKPDFVGWTGLTPIAILLENVFGITADVANRTLKWDVRLLEEHGVNRYPFGKDGLLDLKCSKRVTPKEKPVIDVKPNVKLQIEIQWQGGNDVINNE